jgi:hypothetical protein
MELITLSHHDPKWIDFVNAHPNSCFFHHPSWADLLSETYRYVPFVFTMVDEKDHIVAGLPAMDVRNPLMKSRWVALPFTDYCPPLLSEESLIFAFSEKLTSLAREENKTFIVRSDMPLNCGSRTSYHVKQSIALDPDLDVVGKKMKRTTKQNIRAAEKNGVIVTFSRDRSQMEAYYQLQVETRRRHGLPVQPHNFFSQIQKHVIEPGFGSIVLASVDGTIAAGMVMFHWKETVIAKYAASHSQFWKFRPNNLVFWEAIKWSCQNGYTYFDMGRSNNEDEGLQRYKQSWGANSTPLYYSNMAESVCSRPEKQPPKWMQAFIQKAPCIVCKTTGALIYKYFG